MATTQSKIYEAICEAVLSAVDSAELESAAYKPTKAYTGGLPNGTVKKGSKGTDVKHVQKFLNWAIKAGLSVDGICGKKTVAAIKKFQKAQKIKIDGIFGTQSRRAAQALIKKYAPTPVATPTPEPKKETNADKIVAKAKEFCWPYGTEQKKYSYKTGSAKAAYKAALKKHMGKKAKVSQSDCGYFVNTCVRAAGLGKLLALPGKASQPYPALPSTLKIVHKGKAVPDGLLQPGDIIRYRKKNGHQHAIICYAAGKIAEAGRSHWFPAIKKDTKKYNNSNRVKLSTLQVIRAK